jgi:hypothetical protein
MPHSSWFEIIQFEFSCPFVAQFFATHTYVINDGCKLVRFSFRSYKWKQNEKEWK